MADRTYSGARREQFNLRERAISDDFNRLQGFQAAALAELLRRLHLASAESAEAGGKAAVPSASGAPPAAVIFEGLCARPEIGTVNLFVSAGALAVCLPAASPHPDDDPARVIRDPGVTNAGDLTLTAGAVSTRIDVVECQPYDLVQESDSRDQFDPATGTYAPTLLDKVVRGALAYRIRLGTPGGGLPAPAAGWLPLAVARVPSSATTWDDCDVWDVRPLLADLADPPHRLRRALPRARHQSARAHVAGANDWRLVGAAECDDGEGRLLGGELRTARAGSPAYLQLGPGAGTIQEPGFSASASAPWYVYLLVMPGYSRWAKLSPASSGERTPTEPRGIPVLTQKAPEGLSGKPGSAISLPTATGLGGSTTLGVAVVAGAFGSGAAFLALTVAGGWSQLGEGGIAVAPTSGANTASVTYRLEGGVTHPPHARAVRVRFLTSYADAAGYATSFARRVQVYDAAGGNVLFAKRRTTTETLPVSGAFVDTFELDLELPVNLPTGAALAFDVQLAITATTGGSQAFSSQSLLVLGWRLFE